LPRVSTRSGRTSNRFRQKPERSQRVTRRTPIESEDGGTQIETVTTTRKGRNRTVERRTPIASGGTQSEVQTENVSARQRPSIGQLKPTTAGERVAGVGLLEAEFLIAIFLQILLLFADTNKSYADKIMQTMKRGTMISLLFFILALMAGIGGNSARIAKAIGALVIAAIFLTSPMTDVLGSLDTFFKADWAGTTEHGTDVGATSTPDKSGTTGQGLHAAEGAVNRITQIIESFGFGIIK
jgi:hypothetical protein